MKQQRIASNKSKAAPQIIDSRQPKELPPATVEMAPEVMHIPVRTVIMVDVKDMSAAQVQLLIQELNEVYRESRGGPHYVLPIRHGKIGTDIVFESEFLSVVNKMCEIKDGQIVLREGAQDCHIVRQQI